MAVVLSQYHCIVIYAVFAAHNHTHSAILHVCKKQYNIIHRVTNTQHTFTISRTLPTTSVVYRCTRKLPATVRAGYLTDIGAHTEYSDSAVDYLNG